MIRLRANVAVRLAIGFGSLVIAVVMAMGAIVYLGTVGVIERGIDAKLNISSSLLLNEYKEHGIVGVHRAIDTLLHDNIDQDTEVYLLSGADGIVTGNIAAVPATPDRALSNARVERYGRMSRSRVLRISLADGYTLVVGRDLADLTEIRQLVLRATVVGGALALLLAVVGAILFRRQLEARIATIRRTAESIHAGNFSQRLPEETGIDEFTRLNRSINQMLDRIQRLMDGVRDVSNAIAHDLRTPLGRIRGLLDEAVSSRAPAETLAEHARTAIRGIDDLTGIFDKLLQIAEAESGARRQSFRAVPLGEIVQTVVELYDAEAEAKEIALIADIDETATTLGDRDLLASATANLVDNALKYVGSHRTVIVRASESRDAASIVVDDNGPGIPESERIKVLTRFYRLDRSRSLPGNGLGLPIVNAIAKLHGGSLILEDAKPGLRARIVLPCPDRATLPRATSLAGIAINIDE